jgi:outer membrane receptor protein involved in Fe transport
MTLFAGLDVSVRETAVCVVDEAGKVVAERKVATEPDDLIELLRSISNEYGRIGLEAGPLSQWLVNGLAEAGLPVVCVVLAGLRLENSRTTTMLAGAELRHESDQFQAFPSLHLSYPLGEDRTISASYSRRIDRPTPAQLSPLVTFGNPQDLYSGNPDLQPQETDAFEVAFDAHTGSSSNSATLFYRELHNAFTQVVRDLGDGILLFTQDNLGDARRAGLSLAGNRQLTPTISLNASADAYWMEVPASSLGFGQERSGWVESGRGTLSWSPTASDIFQLNGSVSGRTITPQGTLGAIGLLNLGYRRKLSPALFLVVTMQNVLDSNRQRINYNLPTLRDCRLVDGVGRATLVTLTYNFGSGAQKAHDPNIDYSSGPSVPR